MELLEILVSIAALVFSIYYLSVTIEFWRERRVTRSNNKAQRQSSLKKPAAPFEHGPQRLTSRFFNSNRSKDTFYSVTKCMEHLMTNEADWTAFNHDEEEVTDRFSSDVMKLCAFGSQQRKENEFRENGRRILELIKKKALVFRMAESAPWLGKIIEPMTRDEAKYELFVDTMIGAVEHRRKNYVVKNDVVAALAKILSDHDKLVNIEMSDAIVTASAFAFFASGFEQTGPIASFAEMWRYSAQNGFPTFAHMDKLNRDDDSENQDDETEGGELIVKTKVEPPCISKIHFLTDIRKLVFTRIFMYLNDPTVSTTKKTLVVGSGILSLMTVMKYFPQIRREIGNFCRVLHCTKKV